MSEAQERTVKHTYIEALLRGFKIFDDPAVLETLRRETGFDWQFPKSEYLFETSGLISHFIVTHYMTDVKSQEEAMYRLGYATAAGYRETIVGRVGFVASPMMKPLKIVERVVQVYNDETNYGERICTELSPNYIQVVMKGEPAPADWVRGQFDFALAAHNVQVKSTQTGFEQVTIDITW